MYNLFHGATVGHTTLSLRHLSCRNTAVVPYITHGYGKHVCFKICYRSALFSAHMELFWQNFETKLDVSRPSSSEARCCMLERNSFSAYKADSSVGDDVPHAQMEKTASLFWPGTGSYFWEKKQLLTIASSGDGGQEGCFYEMCRGLAVAAVSPRPLAVCSLPRRQQKSFSDTGAKYTPVGTGFPWEISIFFFFSEETLRLIPSKVH